MRVSFAVSVLLTIFHQSSSSQSVDQPRIVGGEEVFEGQYPFQIEFFVLKYGEIYEHHCGGSILNANTVLTAAHCVSTLEGLGYIRAGHVTMDEGGQKVNVKEIMIHPQYNTPKVGDYDFAILKLEGNLQFDDNVKPVDLPKPDSMVPLGSRVTVTGWGHTKEEGYLSNKLLMVTLFTLETQECQKTFDYNQYEIKDIHICAIGGKGRDACQGDSGGPMTYKNTLYGVVSFGDGCARPGNPGVFANVAKVVPWIQCLMAKE